MTRYTVVWAQQAIDQLAQLWMEGTDRSEVAEAGNAIDRELAVDPGSKGSEVREGLRSLDVPPLRVLFTVEEQDRLVKVLLVRRQPGPPTTTNGLSSTNTGH
jgi:hypothetical protein